jgi:hypothetical protein
VLQSYGPSRPVTGICLPLLWYLSNYRACHVPEHRNLNIHWHKYEHIRIVDQVQGRATGPLPSRLPRYANRIHRFYSDGWFSKITKKLVCILVIVKARPHYSCSCSPGLCSSGNSSGFLLVLVNRRPHYFSCSPGFGA